MWNTILETSTRNQTVTELDVQNSLEAFSPYSSKKIRQNVDQFVVPTTNCLKKFIFHLKTQNKMKNLTPTLQTEFVYDETLLH